MFNVTEVKDGNFDWDQSSVQIKTAESVVTEFSEFVLTAFLKTQILQNN